MLKTINHHSSHTNAQLLGIRHIPNQNRLFFYFQHHDDYIFQNVVDFSLNGFYTQNILLGIHEYNIHNLPPHIAAEFPILSYYIHSGDNWQIFYISPQVGTGGVIICATLE